MARNYKQGDVHYATLNTVGSVQGGIRPVVIMQNNVGNKYSPTVTVVPLTSKEKSSKQPTHAKIVANCKNGLKCDSIVLGEQITTIPSENISRRVGTLDDIELKSVYLALTPTWLSPGPWVPKEQPRNFSRQLSCHLKVISS